MSGNASRKHKEYMLMQKRKKLFGTITPRDELGNLDLVLHGASQGRIITSKSTYDLGRMIVRTKKRNLKEI